MEGNGQGALRKARVVEVLTFLAVILVTPVSMIFAIPFGVSPYDWFSTWQRYVVLFILLAMGLAVLGFAVSTDYRLEADRLGRRNP